MIRRKPSGPSTTEGARQAFLKAAIDVRRLAEMYRTPIVVWDHEKQVIREIPWNEIPETELPADDEKS